MIVSPVWSICRYRSIHSVYHYFSIKLKSHLWYQWFIIAFPIFKTNGHIIFSPRAHLITAADSIAWRIPCSFLWGNFGSGLCKLWNSCLVQWLGGRIGLPEVLFCNVWAEISAPNIGSTQSAVSSEKLLQKGAQNEMVLFHLPPNQ